jgi:hypothetical protein
VRTPDNIVVSDAAKRASDAYNLHRVADPNGCVGKWIAVRLSDGTTDNVLYDSKSAAVDHQHHDEDFYAFVQIGPWQFTPEMAETYLTVQRRMYGSNSTNSFPFPWHPAPEYQLQEGLDNDG